MTKDFHLSDVLSVSTGYLISNRGMRGIYDIMNHVFEDSLSTIGLMMMADKARDEVLRQHPQLVVVNDELAERETSGLLPKRKDEWDAWLAQEIARFGEYLPIKSMENSPGAPSLDEQMAEAMSINPKLEIITVIIDD
jgi:hypothetical protein